MSDDDTSKRAQTSRSVDITVTRAADQQLDPRWFLYPAYILTLSAGGLASQFALRTEEWSTIPVMLAWTLLFIWYWLYGVAFRYRRPVLKYFSLAGALGFGGLLCAFCLDRAAPQYAVQAEGAAVRTLEHDLVWAGVATGITTVIIGLHVILFGRARR